MFIFFWVLNLVAFLSINNEINYVKLLNGVLPDEIRAICWSPVTAEMSARFDCVERVYRYYLPKYIPTKI